MTTDFINPTRMELARLKREMEITIRGHKLLKDKQDELIRRFMQIIEITKNLRIEVDRLLVLTMQKLNVATAKSSAAEIYNSLLTKSSLFTVSFTKRPIMSVYVPNIELKQNLNEKHNYSLPSAPVALDQAVLMLKELLPKLISLAMMEKQVDLLSYEIEKTRRRVNAIEHIRLPALEENIKMIVMKLDDIERFNTVRMMKSKEITQKKK